MSDAPPQAAPPPAAGSARASDGVVTFWVVLWLVLGGWTGYQVWQLTGLAQATVESGRSLQSVASAVEQLDDVPVVGGTTAPIADRIDSTARDVVASGREAESSVRGLAVLIGLAVGIGPIGPVLVFYLPSRLARARPADARV